MKWVKRLLPFGVAIVLVAFFLRQIRPTEVIHMLTGLDWRWLLIGFGAYIGTNVLRAFRYGVLLEKVAPHSILPEMFVLSFFNNILPSRSGELSFPYFMYRGHGVSVGDSSAALIVARIMDFAAVAVLYIAFASFNLDQLAPGESTAVLIVAGLLLLVLAGLFGAPWIGRQLLDALTRILRKRGCDGRSWSAAILHFGRQAVMSLERMRTQRTQGRAFIWSLLIWLGTFAWFAAFMRAIGLQQPFSLVIVGATFAVFAKAIAWFSVGGIGAHEVGWTVGFILVGLSEDQAIASGLVVDILTLVASVICGLIALGWIWTRSHDWHRQPSVQSS